MITVRHFSTGRLSIFEPWFDAKFIPRKLKYFVGIFVAGYLRVVQTKAFNFWNHCRKESDPTIILNIKWLGKCPIKNLTKKCEFSRNKFCIKPWFKN